MEWARDLLGLAGEDAWISVLLAGLASLLFGSLIVYAVALYPDARPGRLFVTAFGPWLGGLLSLGFALYALAEAARVARITVELIQFAVLPTTPIWILLGLGLLITAVALVGGIQSLLRYQFALFWPTLLLAVAALSLGFRYADWAYFLPVLGEGMVPVFQGVTSMVEPLLGLELGLVYLPYFRRRGLSTHQALYGLWGGTAAALALYLYVTVALLVGFGPFETAVTTWPVIEAVRRTYLTGLFFERLDILFLIALGIATTVAQNFYTHAALLTLQQTFSLPLQRWQIWASVLAVWAFASLPRNLAEVDWWRLWVLEPLGLVYLTLVPVLLIGAGLLRRWRRSRALTA